MTCSENWHSLQLFTGMCYVVIDWHLTKYSRNVNTRVWGCSVLCWQGCDGATAAGMLAFTKNMIRNIIYTRMVLLLQCWQECNGTAVQLWGCRHFKTKHMIRTVIITRVFVDSICAALCSWQGCDGTPAAGLLILCCALLSLVRRASTMALPWKCDGGAIVMCKCAAAEAAVAIYNIYRYINASS